MCDTSSGGKLDGLFDRMLTRLDRRERVHRPTPLWAGSQPKDGDVSVDGKQTWVSKERVRQLENRAVGKLRTMAAEMGLADILE
jgi:DNA-directed RNA polymerase sigma subunit (sigma70/sigma32)